MNSKSVYFFAFALVLIACTLAVLSVFSWKRRKKSPAALSLAGLLATLVLYTGGYAGELLSPTLERMLFWNSIEYLGISFIPTLWILFAARYVNTRWIRDKRVVGILFFISLTTLFAPRCG